MTAASDTLLGKRYRLLSRIAGGGMGEVWSATDEVLGRNVAVKILRRELADDPTFVARFRAEARHTASLSHGGIAAVYDYSDGAARPTRPGSAMTPDESPSPFLVMENVPGEPLSEVIARDGQLSAERTLDVIGQAALALQAAHDAGVVHRDVKPGNILLTPDGTVKITDFGIARAVHSAPLTATGAIMGTAYYLSPEQASGRSATPASDVYALGVVAYECLSGRRPFPGDTPVSVALAQVRDQPPDLGPEVAEDVAALVMTMLAKDPAERPPSAGELGRAALDLRLSGGARPVEPAPTRTLPVAQPLSDGPDTPGEDVMAAARVSRLATDTDPGFLLPPPERRRHWLPYAAGLVALTVVALLVVRACTNQSATDGATAEDTASGGSQSIGEAVLVRASDYVGRPVDDARAALRHLGLQVSVLPVPADKHTAVGTVTAVSPTGRLSPDEPVTLEFARSDPGRAEQGKPAKKHKHHKDNGRQKGQT